MDQYIQFFIAHWQLSLLFVGAFLWVISSEAQTRAGNGLVLSVTELTQKINRDGAAVVDLRSEAAFSAGHIINASNISLEDLKQDQVCLNKYKDRPIVLVDDQGSQATKVMQQLRKKGRVNIFALKGGVNAWKQATLPLVSGKK